MWMAHSREEETRGLGCIRWAVRLLYGDDLAADCLNVPWRRRVLEGENYVVELHDRLKEEPGKI